MYLHSRRILFQKGISALCLTLFSRRLLAENVQHSDIFTTLHTVQRDLYAETDTMPSYEAINALVYLKHVLKQPRVAKAHKRFIVNGVRWLNEASIARYKKHYTKLAAPQRNIVLQTIVQEQWGKRWIETLLTYIYEAMLGDPVYGGNRNEVGWKWLHHTPGKPRPTKALV